MVRGDFKRKWKIACSLPHHTTNPPAHSASTFKLEGEKLLSDYTLCDSETYNHNENIALRTKHLEHKPGKGATNSLLDMTGMLILTNSQHLWLAAQNLYKTEPTSIPGWMGRVLGGPVSC